MTRPLAKEATAYHEAGHMFAAWWCGIRIRQATIIPGRGFAGKVRHQRLFTGLRLDIDNSSDRARQRAEKAILISLAGPVAQKRYRISSWRAFHGSEDRDWAADLAKDIYGSAELANAYLEWMDVWARHLVEAYWPMVRGFAEALLARETLNRADIVPLVDKLSRENCVSPNWASTGKSE